MAENLTPSPRLQQLCRDQRERWNRGDKALVETYVQRYPELRSDEELLLDFICGEYSLRAEHGESPALAEYTKRFPGLAPQLQALFDVLEAIDRQSLLQPPEQEMIIGSRTAAPPNVTPGAFQQSPKVLSPIVNGATPRERVGSIIGPYKLLQQIGEGGFGVVYMAEQEQPVRRLVALKIIKPGMDTSQVIARFESERQALALMDHPNIARVLDAGATGSGHPYFVMELVKGVPITDFCDKNHLATDARLKLFLNVCHAIQHAHHKGIIHRDIKPSNVMVTLHDGIPVVKVIDFGVAKATVQKLTERTLFTAYGQMLGTPAYMSPEQAEMSGLDIDTRSDVYSLGVLLYELLTGTTPLEANRLREAGYAEMQRLIREEDPPRPSTRLSSLGDSATGVAGNRGLEVKRLVQLLASDLDWVVMKALEKDRNRRYDTPASFAEDIERYLADETIEARPASAGYRLRKILRRNKGPVLSASLIFLALVSGVFGTTLGLFEAKRHEGEAKRQEQLAVAAQKQEALRADSEAKLAKENGLLAQSERDASTLARNNQKIAEGKAAELKVALAQSYFRQGLREYDAGRPNSALADLTRALAMTGPEHPLCTSYRRVLVDRCLQGGKQLLPPLWHAGPVRTVAFSPDGTRVVTGSLDKTARIWDVSTGASLGKKMEHERAVEGVAFSPDGTRLITRSGKLTRLWDGYSGAPLGAVMEHEGDVTSAMFSPDATFVVTGSRDGTARLWNAHSGVPTTPRMRHDASVYCVTFSPDGRRVATGCGVGVRTGSAQLWDATTGGAVGKVMRHSDIVYSVVFSPDGTRILTGSQDGTARVWDAQSGAPIGPLIRRDCPIGNAIFSPDGTRILTHDGDFGWEYRSYTAQLWDAMTGAPVGAAMNHEGYVQAIAFSPDGTRVVTASQGRVARLWDGYTGGPVGEVMKHQSYVGSVAFSPDGTRLLTGSDDNTARLWSADTGIPIGQEMRHPHQDHGTAVAFSPDGTRVITGSAKPGKGRVIGTAHLWDAHTGAPIGEEMQHERQVTSVAFSPDGTRVATGSGRWNSGGLAELWDAHTGVRVGQAIRHAHLVWQVAFNPDGTRVVTSSQDGTARLWDPHTATPLGKVMKHDLGIRSLAISPDGTRVVTSSDDGTVRLWDAHTGTPCGAVMKHEGLLRTVAISPDGTRVVAGSENGTARLWDAHTGTPLGEVLKHEGEVRSVAFSPDGMRVVTGSTDYTARLWDAHTGFPLGEEMRHDGNVTDVAFSPDGMRIITGSYSKPFGTGGMVRLWDVQTGAPVGEAMINPDRVTSVAFSPDGTCVVAGCWRAARLWDVTILDFEPHSMSRSREILKLWTGIGADSDGTLHKLSLDQLDAIRQQVGGDDPLHRFVTERWQRRADAHDQRAVEAAESAGHWSVAVFHLKKILKTSPINPLIQSHLTFALAKELFLSLADKGTKAFTKFGATTPNAETTILRSPPNVKLAPANLRRKESGRN
jgi:eukaryotic-like serine/threonine-protein kinase